MTIKLAVIIDPIESLNIKKDSTFAMIKEAAHRGWEIYYCTHYDLFIDNSKSKGHFTKINFSYNNNNSEANINPNKWYDELNTAIYDITDFNIILQRKDPPFDLEYIYLSYILELAQNQINDNNLNCIIANNPVAVRNNNEKLTTLKFPHIAPPSLVTANKSELIKFTKQHNEIVVKPLDGMGGRSIFKLAHGDTNTSVILDTITNYGSTTILAQKFIPEIKNGDKRVLLINGEAIPYGLARMPTQGDFRGNLAAGATGVGFELSERDKYICDQVGPYLRNNGLYFVGVDIIGDYITEINVTSPTCIQEIDKSFNLNISASFLDCLVNILQNKKSQ